MKKLITTARTTEVDDTSDRLIVLFNNEPALKDDTFLKPLFSEMSTLSAQITESIRRDRTFSELEDADAQRDDKLRAVSDVLTGYLAMPLPLYSQPATRLYGVFRKYGVSIAKENYAVESSLIESLLTDFGAAGLQADITALPGLTETITNLRVAQTNFTVKRVAYESAIAAEGSAALATELKVSLITLINNRLVPYLSTMKMVDPTRYGRFADTAAQIIADTNGAILVRSKKPQSTTPEPVKAN